MENTFSVRAWNTFSIFTSCKLEPIYNRSTKYLSVSIIHRVTLKLNIYRSLRPEVTSGIKWQTDWITEIMFCVTLRWSFRHTIYNDVDIYAHWHKENIRRTFYGWNTQHDFCPDLCPRLTLWRSSVPVCRFELADFIKNYIVYEFRVTDPIFEHILFSFFMHLLFAWDCCDQNN